MYHGHTMIKYHILILETNIQWLLKIQLFFLIFKMRNALKMLELLELFLIRRHT